MLLLAYLGGVLTILSPCILPVVPFVFARTEQSFARGTLPLLLGMVMTFGAVVTLAAVGGSWAIEVNQYGRWGAMALLLVSGGALLWPALSDRLAAPFLALGNRLARSVGPAARQQPGIGPSLILGAATGLLWAPCAGPILGLILTRAALQGANLQTSLLSLAYGAGAATSLAVAILIGGRVFVAMKRSLPATAWIRRGLGAAIVGAVIAIALGLDTGFLTRVSLASTTSVEQRLIDRWRPGLNDPPPAPGGSMAGGAAMSGGATMSGSPAMSGGAMSGGAMSGGAMTGGAMTGSPAMAGGAMMSGSPAMSGGSAMSGDAATLAIEGPMPPLDGATEWLNSPPLTTEGLRGKVVLIDFWTYSCINCLRAIPYVRAWQQTYGPQGLVVIGVHSPEFAFEKTVANVRTAAAGLQIRYPVAIDNNYAIWRAFNNRFWPAHYFVDVSGRVRYRHFGEGGYEESERVIQALLSEAGRRTSGVAAVYASAGAEAASNEADVLSPETYIGYQRAERFVSPGGAAEDAVKVYGDGDPRLNEWGLNGSWSVGKEQATLQQAGGAIVYRFHARDVHLVLAAGAGTRIRFRVTIDGQPPGEAHGVDVDAAGLGVVSDQRLYQLIRQRGTVGEHTFAITFLDPGVQAYAFTFG